VRQISETPLVQAFVAGLTIEALDERVSIGGGVNKVMAPTGGRPSSAGWAGTIG
jgi:hypothetical protein